VPIGLGTIIIKVGCKNLFLTTNKWIPMKFAIIGCGVAGVNAAIVLRKNDAEAEISIYTDEGHLCYPRPRLYEVISGQKQPENIYSYPSKFYEEQRINVHMMKKAVRLNLAGKTIMFEDNSRAEYDKLLLANGAHPFVPPIKGIEKSGFFTLRTVDDALSIRERIMKTRRAIVVGEGLLGLELAVSLRKAGQEITVIGLLPRLLPKQLDQEASETLKEYLEKLGINLVLDAVTKEILGKDEVDGASIEGGRKIEGEIVVAATGVRPNIGLASSAGIKTATGIIVDQHLQTSVDDVYAAGDVIEFNGQVYGMIPPALEQARIAAVNMTGKEEQTYRGTVPVTTLRLAEINLTSMGLVNPQGSDYEEIKMVNKRDGVYKKLVLQQGRIVGAIILGRKEDTSSIRKLMEQGTDVSQQKNALLKEPREA
jgi:nitrite reductase (NADH) large subunit